MILRGRAVLSRELGARMDIHFERDYRLVVFVEIFRRLIDDC